MNLLQQVCTRNLLHVLTLLENVVTSALMSYALLYEAGNVVDLPDKRIGFCNFCLWNGTAGELQCLDNEHLEALGISLLVVVLARICVYSCLVIILFYTLFVLFVNYTGQTEEVKSCSIPCAVMIALSVGLVMLLSHTWQWFSFSGSTGGFLALLCALALLLLQILTPTAYLRWAQHRHMALNHLTEEALPTKI